MLRKIGVTGNCCRGWMLLVVKQGERATSDLFLLVGVGVGVGIGVGGKGFSPLSVSPVKNTSPSITHAQP